jgi:hypothetical protein
VNDFDKAARYAARLLDPEGFLLWILGETLWQAWRWLGWLDTQSVPFPGEPDRRADTVPYFDHRQGQSPPLATVIEFMSQARNVTPERLAEYGLRLRRELPYQTNPRVEYDVIGIVVNLTGQAAEENWAVAPPDCDGLGLWGRVGVRNLCLHSAQDTLAAIASKQVAHSVLPWVPLMLGAEKSDIVDEWRRLGEDRIDQIKRAEYGGLALVFADLVDRFDVWKKGLEGWNVERSRVTLEWEEHAAAREHLRTVRSKLLRVLQVRFGESLPTDIVHTIEGQEAPDVLDRWFDQALVINSLDEMRSAIGLVAD